MTAKAMIEFRGVTKRYGSLVANDHLDLAARRGELLTLLGRSGCGKTTAPASAAFEAIQPWGRKRPPLDLG